MAVPPLVMTSLTWGLFMGVSSNVRYQIVFGLERAVRRDHCKVGSPGGLCHEPGNSIREQRHWWGELH